jgi:hypothetical protein
VVQVGRVGLVNGFGTRAAAQRDLGAGIHTLRGLRTQLVEQGVHICDRRPGDF